MEKRTHYSIVKATLTLIILPFLVWSCGSDAKKSSGGSKSKVKFEQLNGYCYKDGKELTNPSHCKLPVNGVVIGDGKQCFDTIRGALTDMKYCQNANPFSRNNTNQCWDNVKNVATKNEAYCNGPNTGGGGTNGQFVFENGMCIDKNTRQPVPQALCPPIPGGKACKGWYYTFMWGQWYTYYCFSGGCRGMIVYDMDTAERITCN